MKKQSKMIIGITAGAMLVAVIAIVAVLMASGSDSRNYAKHMESAQHYMDGLDYEQAIAEYRAAIEIEPNNVEAYRALAELYVQTGDYEAAIAVLNQGMEQMSSEELSDYIEEVQAAYEEQQKELVEATVQEESVAEDSQEQTLEEMDEDRYNHYLEQAEQEQRQEEGQKAQSQQEISQAETQDSEELAEENDAKKEVLYYPDGSYWVEEYDGNGNRVKGTHYNADETLNFYDIYEYDGNGNNVRDTHYNADGTLDYYGIHE